MGRFGRKLADLLDTHTEINYLIVDFDPAVIKDWKEKGKDVIYGDMEDPDLLDQIPYDDRSIIVSTVVNNELSQQLMLEGNKYKGRVFVTTSTEKDYKKLRDFGMDDKHIIRPHQMAAAQFYRSFLQNKPEG